MRVNSYREHAADYFKKLQADITSALAALDGGGFFREDPWSHPLEGGGSTQIIERARIFEKGGVNYSQVRTMLSSRLAARLKVAEQHVSATGISLVLHPESPMIPTVHMNLRYLELDDGDAWFGGGMDLTPWYLFEEDARHFHRILQSVCNRFDPSMYARFKKWCDSYFFLDHRNECRGIGGIFFDYQRERLPEVFEFVKALGPAFLEAYIPIVKHREKEPWGEREKYWQLLRRGRYVEFNLVYDQGTLFGLDTRGRPESVLMSLPPEVRWTYNYEPESGSREAALVEILRHPREWVEP